MAHHDCTECDLNNFEIGQRVKAHPATDCFMRGDVYGTVRGVGRNIIAVLMDRSGKERRFTRCNLLPVEG